MNTPPTQVYVGFSEARSLRAAIADIIRGLEMVHLWGTLGWQDLKQRYRRSVLGPFWLTISAGIMVGAIGFLYSKIFGQSIQDYIPYLAVGFIVWNFLSATINEGCNVFVNAEAIIKQVKLPLTAHVCRLLWSNLLIFAHNAVVILLTVLIFQKGSLWPGILALPGLALITFNCLWIVMVLGIFCARFRDITPIITNLMQIAFFLTPIFWTKDLLGDRGWFADINPFFHMIEVMRAPLLGSGIPYTSFGFLLLVGLLGTVSAIAALSRFRARVPYWI